MSIRLKALTAAAGLAGLTGHAAGSAAEPSDVVLRLKDSLIEVAGALRSFDGETYVVDARAFGVLSLPADRYLCEGTSCAPPTRTAAAGPAGAPAFDFAASGPGDAAVIDRFAISGSDTVGRELMPALIRAYATSMGGSARQLLGSNPDVTQFRLLDKRGAPVTIIDIERSSPAAAIASVARGTAAIAMSTRPMLESEASALMRSAPDAQPRNLEHVLAIDGLAVVVPPESPARALPVETLAGIFSGKVTDWSEVGLPGGRISLYVGPDSAGAADAFSDLVLRPGGLALAPSATRLANEAEVSDAVARDPRGIGITSYGVLRNARPLPISTSCGLTWSPDEFSIKAEEYPLGRRLYLYASAKAAGAHGLVKFANSSAAQATIAGSLFLDQSVVAAPFSEQGLRVTRWLDTAQAGSIEKRLAGGLIEEISDGRRLSLTFRFALGSSQLDAKAREDLNRLAQLLQSEDYAQKTVLLLGFTDWVGTPESNVSLAERRAGEVRDAVLASIPAGRVDANRLVAKGYGAVAPVACNDSPEGMNKNRRVEVWVRDRAPTQVARVTPKADLPVRYRKRQR